MLTPINLLSAVEFILFSQSQKIVTDQENKTLGGFNMNTKTFDNKLGFIQFLKIRTSKNGKNILIFISPKNCIAIPKSYLEKVMADQSENLIKEDIS